MSDEQDDDDAQDSLDPADAPAGEVCERCGKPGTLCVCDRLEPLARKPRTQVVILQHPREPDRLLGTAHLTELLVPGTKVVVGLSWASLSHALDREVDPTKWAVLYLGSLKKPLTAAQEKAPIVVLERSGEPRDVKRHPLQGIVLLDGTWSQAKTLWWRNPWMLRLGRLILHPTEPSAYGRMRKEPRRECLSTIESVGEALAGLGEGEEARKRLRTVFRTLIQRARDAHDAARAANPLPAPKRPRRPGVQRKRTTGGARGGGPMD